MQAQAFLPAIALVLGVAAGTANGGDPDVADLLLKKARKALGANDLAQAEESFRRALAETSPLPEAHAGLGETLEKAGRTREAADAYRDCLREIGAEALPSPERRRLRGRVEQALSRLLRRFDELNRVNDAFVTRCVAFATRHAKANPAWARRAAETALRVDPDHAVAKGLLAKLPAGDPQPAAPPEPSGAAGRWGETLLRADDLADWDGDKSLWTCKHGVVAADVPGSPGQLLWYDADEFEGDYGLRVRFRMARVGGAKRTFGLFLGGDGRSTWWSVMFTREGQVVLERYDGDEPETVKEAMLRNFDPAAWHLLEVRVRGGEAAVLLDDREMLRHAADERDDFDGKISLFVQDCGMEWRELEAKR